MSSFCVARPTSNVSLDASISATFATAFCLFFFFFLTNKNIMVIRITDKCQAPNNLLSPTLPVEITVYDRTTNKSPGYVSLVRSSAGLLVTPNIVVIVDKSLTI